MSARNRFFILLGIIFIAGAALVSLASRGSMIAFAVGLLVVFIASIVLLAQGA